MTRYSLARAASDLLGEDIAECAPLGGGDLSDVVRIVTVTGRRFIAKSGPAPETECAMLRAIRGAGAAAPRPVEADGEVLVLEDLGPGGPASEAGWRRLGESLRRLHAARAGAYGWDADYAFGAVVIRNGRRATWPRFWIEARLLADPHALPPDVVDRLRLLRPSMEARLPERPPASLLHGDLWAGNVHFGPNGGAWLIDPACYHGDAEVDLAMLTLFGSPPDCFFEAYGPLREGWRRRRPIYQLWPALVHLRLFGGGYRALVERLMDEVG